MTRRCDSHSDRKRTKWGTTPVSAFILLDSLEAIERCIAELRHFAKYGMPDFRDSDYFDQIRTIYQAGTEVCNFDRDVELRWRGKPVAAILRCHFFDAGRYELELWLPGAIANDARAVFRDGHEGFFCAFMPPSFYD